MPHVIRRQILELGVPSREGALELQDEVRRLYHRRVVPAMDGVLSRFGAGGEVLRLDRVELDLGELDPAALGDEFVRRTEAELGNVLAERTATLGCRPSVGPERRFTAEEAGPRWLGSFLTTGVMPWWVPSAVAADPEAALAELVDAAPAALAATLRQTAGPRALRRLRRQFSPALRRRLVAVLAAERTEFREVVADWQRLLAGEVPELPGAAGQAGEPETRVADRILAHLVAAPAADGPAVSKLAVAALAAFAGTGPGAVVRALAPRARRRLPPASPLRAWLSGGGGWIDGEDPGGRRRIAGEHRDAPRPASRQTGEDEGGRARAAGEPQGKHWSGPEEPGGELPSRLGRREGLPLPPPEASPGAASGRGALQPAGAATVPLPRGPAPPAAGSEPGVPPRPAAERLPAPSAATPAPPEELLAADGALFVDDAGLVLLAPFLSSFFAEVALVEERAFVSEAARERAVLLLRYLATATAGACEHFLVLDKLLCGWPLAEPLCREIEPTGLEVRESEELLSAVVRHWTALGNTSVEGLRASFLAREGRLTEGDLGWQLTVQRTGHDVLLDRLPWGLGPVLLPWMERPLFVEW